MTTFIHTDVECPKGHVFDVRRRYESAGIAVSTRCPACQMQFRVTVPNAKPPAARKLLERDIEARLVKRVFELGGEVRKVSWIGRNSAPDRIVMLPEAITLAAHLGGVGDGAYHPPTTIWVELKAPGRAATFPKTAHEKAQHREHERMRKMGQRVEVVDSYERIEEILK